MQARPISFNSISVTEEILAEYEGVYRFDLGRALSIIVSPEFSSSGLEYFGRSLMMTDFETATCAVCMRWTIPLLWLECSAWWVLL
ncbi:MAG: hypothetical protein IPO36_14680 [Anaerolineales bacterium]|nr:hypothetical protein [Anaerolineales bacterium]